MNDLSAQSPITIVARVKQTKPVSENGGVESRNGKAAGAEDTGQGSLVRTVHQNGIVSAGAAKSIAPVLAPVARVSTRIYEKRTTRDTEIQAQTIGVAVPRRRGHAGFGAVPSPRSGRVL